VIQVHAAPQRNQKSARGISSGTTFCFVGPSSFAAIWAFTKLKK